jgi:heme oxygenase
MTDRGLAPVLARLRAETRAQHEHLERVMPSLRVATAAGYLALLRRQHGFYAPLEARLLVHATDPRARALELPSRRKAPLLARDIAAVAATLGEDGDTASLPCCTALPDVATLPAALGACYVLEGATLGGQLMLRHVGESLALDATNGAAFYASYGDRIGPMWRGFGRAVTALVDEADGRDDGTGPCADRVVAAACETFDAFARWCEAGGGAARWAA